MKTLGIRLDDGLHAQLSVVAQLEGQALNDVIRRAIEAYIGQRKQALSNRAETALAEIERDAAARRQAITTLFGDDPTTAPATPAEPAQPGSRSGGRGKEGGATR